MMMGPMGACHVTEIPVDILNRLASNVLQFSYTLPTSKNNAIREPPPFVNGVVVEEEFEVVVDPQDVELFVSFELIQSYLTSETESVEAS